MERKRDVRELEFPFDNYTDRVLIGNWFERRLTPQIDRHAIVPIKIGKSDCTDAISQYSISYRPLTAKEKKENHEQKLEQDCTLFHNTLYGQGSRLKEKNPIVAKQVLTTMSDFYYRILPKKLKETGRLVNTAGRKYDIPYTRDIEPTCTGLRREKFFAKWRARINPDHLSTVQDHYRYRPPRK